VREGRGGGDKPSSSLTSLPKNNISNQRVTGKIFTFLSSPRREQNETNVVLKGCAAVPRMEREQNAFCSKIGSGKRNTF